MLYGLISIAGMLITIIFVIGTHESAHFFTAKLLGVKVLRFSIGFGKSLFTWRDKQGTEYIFALIPLGGYVKMLDESEGPVADSEKHLAYNRQPYYKKFLIVMAGPLSNLICAFLLYWLIFMIGFVSVKPIIGQVTPKSIAEAAGLQPNRQIVRVDGTETSSWISIIFQLLYHAGNDDTINLSTADLDGKNQQTHTLNVKHWKMDPLTPDPLLSLGFTPYEPVLPLVIGLIDEKGIAATSGLRLGDEIISIDKIEIKDWQMLINIISKHPDKTLPFIIKRDGKLVTLPITIGSQRSFTFIKTGYLGIAPYYKWPPNMLETIQYGPIDAAKHAFRDVSNFTYFNLLLLGKMVTGKLSIQGLGGPITIFQSAGSALNASWLSFLSFLAFLSISIGIVNFLPIPGLDGGHLLFQTIEAIMGRPIPERVMINLFKLGLFLLLFVLLQAFYNDILRLY